MKAKKGDWVQIHQIVLEPEKRAPQVPNDTKKVPLELWVKGYILSDAEIGDSIEIETVTGRRITGTLKIINPNYTHSFGNFVPELLKVDKIVKTIFFGDVNE